MLLDREIAEERSLEHLDVKVLAPDGNFVKVSRVYRTVPMEVWRVRTDRHTLECAGRHLIVTDLGTIPVDRVRNGALVLTEDGWEPILSIVNTGESRELYDLQVESEDHLYFTGGIASHNSTGIIGAELFKFNIFPHYKCIYLTPLREQSKTIADLMLSMQRGSVYPPSYLLSKGYRNNMYYC